jgi:hypothetical protein
MMEGTQGSEGRPQINAGKLRRALDSTFLTKKVWRSKLDSLMREMDKREQRRMQELKEKENRN